MTSETIKFGHTSVWGRKKKIRAGNKIKILSISEYRGEVRGCSEGGGKTTAQVSLLTSRHERVRLTLRPQGFYRSWTVVGTRLSKVNDNHERNILTVDSEVKMLLGEKYLTLAVKS